VGKVTDSHGWDLEGVDILELSSSIDDAIGEADYTVFRPSEIELGETTKRLIGHFDRIEADRVVIDSLSELRLLAHDAQRYRRQIPGLKHYFAQKNTTVLLLDDRTVQAADLRPQSIAHGVIELSRVPKEYGDERRRLRVVKLRGLKFMGGFHDYAISTGGLVVFPRIGSPASHKPFDDETASTGVPEFDTLLGGGLDRGTSTLLTGPAGTGKSSLALSIIDDAAKRGEASVVFAFEENLHQVRRRTSAMGMHIDEHIDSGLIRYRAFVPAEVSPGEFAAEVHDAVEAGARFIFIDSLNGYLNSMPEERFLAPQLHELLGYLNSRGVVTLLALTQRGIMGAGMDAAVDVSYLTDTVVILRHFEAFGTVRKALSVLKKRTGPHENSIRELRFGTDGVRVGEALTDFRGILTGVPSYDGVERNLIARNGNDARG
jgi:circadian clock protein KaiC